MAVLKIMPDGDSCWAALETRNRAADGTFVYAVRTTGIYCRPSCAARRPRAKNVVFYPTCEAAERAGFRPCLRCRPNGMSQQEKDTQAVVAACRLIEEAESLPALADLAESVGLSPYHFHRVFKSVTGLTPKAYAAAHRAKILRETLPAAHTVTAAIYESGFNSSGRFYAAAPGVLGMVPTSYRRGGSRTRIHFAVGECSLGSIIVGAAGKGICAILLGDDPDGLVRDLQDRFPHADLVGGDADFERIVAAVVGLVEQPKVGLDLPLDIRGTAFQQRVWQALREIGVGRTATYTEIAARIGQPTAVRAVAQACAANPLAVAIPCHRVVRTDGDLSGYRWGVERKRELLKRETAA
jgi:AraC family transcriptional regulator of adaptative response/methylated-DNA-[protein]-cysteine methyltransferase